MTLRQQLNSEKTMKNEMRSEMTYLFWLSYVIFLFMFSAFGSCFRTLAVILVSDFCFSVFSVLVAVLLFLREQKTDKGKGKHRFIF